ncbi:MAG: hypothetical protein HPY45_02645 [Anaerolineae bacterium]|nr:hypothetical protein [Anaerolineae bacterium]
MREIACKFFAMFAVLVLMSCGTRISTPEAGMQLPTVEAVPSVAASSTPTAQPAKVILVSPPGRGDIELLQATITELAEETGMVLTIVPALEAQQVTQDVKIVILLSPMQNLPDLLAAAPQTQFVVLSSVDLTQAGNLNVIRLQPEKQGFVAGYLSMLVAYDYRAAALLPVEEPLGTTLEDAFRSGSGYYCGICASVSSPVIRFPLIARLSSASDASVWQPTVESLRANVVYAMYISPESANPDMVSALAQQGYILIGGQTPPQEVMPRWAATVEYDTLGALQEAWPALVAGDGGRVISPSLRINDINRNILSAGRQRLVEDVMAKLEAGAVYPFTVPAQ